LLQDTFATASKPTLKIAAIVKAIAVIHESTVRAARCSRLST